MALTPADVHNVAFNKPPLGRRGYNEDEVDAFLDRVEAELTELISDREVLREKLDAAGTATPQLSKSAEPASTFAPAADDSALRKERDALKAERDALKAERDKLAAERDSLKAAHDKLRVDYTSVGDKAQQITRQHTALVGERDNLAAKLKAAEASLHEATEKANEDPSVPATRLMAMAQEVANRVEGDAKAEATKIVGDANKQAELLLGKARDEAAKTDADHKRLRTDLDNKIEQLKMFERTYRSQLRAYLQSQLSELDGAKLVDKN